MMQLIKQMFLGLVMSLSALYTPAVFAVETSGLLEVIIVRPIGESVYITLNGDLCGTNVFRIPVEKKAMVATALTALAAEKRVKVEVEECAGWGATLRSLYLHK